MFLSVIYTWRGKGQGHCGSHSSRWHHFWNWFDYLFFYLIFISHFCSYSCNILVLLLLIFVLVTYLRELLPGAWAKSFRWDEPPLELVQVVLLVFGDLKICILIFKFLLVTYLKERGVWVKSLE